MDFSINAFKQVAGASWFNSNIVLNKAGDGVTSRFFSARGEAAKSSNAVTMAAFKGAMIEEYGVFGQEAFEKVLKERMTAGSSLRKNDILKTIAEAEKNLDLIRGGLRGVAESVMTKLLTKDPDLSRLSQEGKQDLRALTLKTLETNLADDNVVRTINRNLKDNAKAFTDYLRQLALDAMPKASEQVLDLDA